MSIPSFSRVEIRHDNVDDLVTATKALGDLAAELRRIAASVIDSKLMRLAAHNAIRETSSNLRGTR